MSVIADIVATYRGPAAVLRRRAAGGQREDRALVILMAGCALLFVAQWPKLSRQAFETGQDLQMLIGAALLNLIFVMPLILYVLAGLSHALARLFGGRGDYFKARMALFWAVLASAPVLLLDGLMQGFAGPGPQSDVTGFVALAVFLWFWLGGLIATERGLA